MAKRFIIIIAVVLYVTTHARTQYIDFFQSFNAFIQPQTTRRPDITRRPTIKQTSKRFQDTIFFETDDFLKQRQNGRGIDPFTTTIKPRKTKTTRKPTTRHQAIERKNYENQINNYDNNLYNYENTVTQKPYFIAQMIPSRQTTVNPLLYRPGVRPAVVDENRPPITNRPVTNRPIPVSDGPVIEIGPDEDKMDEVEKRRFIDIAEQKCEEYKSLNKKKLVALPLASVHASQGVELQVDTCAPTTVPLIIGGKVVSIQEFPHMGLLGWKNIQKSGYTWKCGGSLVSEKYVLTAGHCTYHEKDYNVISGPPSAVQLGSSYIDGADALVVSITSVIRHPKYKTRRSYYDVALVKLETTVKFSKSISPACLGVPPPIGNRVITTGWGRTEFGGDSSNELRSVSIPIWEMGECRAVWGTSRKMPEGPSSASQLCAGEKEGGKDTCQGDSGGPAQIQDGCTWRVVAVTSIGRSCGAKETPALYAKIPRAFIAAEIFSDVKLNSNNNQGFNNRHNENNQGNNDRFNENNNRFNENNNRFNENNNDNGRYNENNQGSNNRYNENQGSNNRYNENNQGSNNRYNENQGTNNRYNENSNQGSNNRYNENNNQGSNNRYNENNNQGSNNRYSENSSQGSNNRYSENNNQGVNDRYNENNNRFNYNNNQGNNGYNNRENNQNRDEVRRPGNHQTIGAVGNDWSNRDSISNTKPTNHQTISSDWSNSNVGVENRPGNHQSINRATNQQTVDRRNLYNQNSGDEINRPGNHQTVNNNSEVRYFATSHTTGKDTEIRLGNHQMVDNRRDTPNYFVTSHTRETGVSRTGNHQTVGKRVTAGTFVTSQAVDRETTNLPGNHQRLGNRGDGRLSDSQNSESNQNVHTQEPNDLNNQYGVISYNPKENIDQNRNTNSKTTQSYSNYQFPSGSTTESVEYNAYNNGYVNFNRGFALANRPWWNR